MAKVSPLKRVWQLVDLEKEEITSIYFYAIMSGLVQLSVPIGIQAIIGFVLGASMVTSIYILILLVVAGVITIGLLQINQMKIIEKVQQNIFTRYAFEFSEVLPRIDLLKSDNYYLPEKVNRFFDTISIQKGLSKLLLDVPSASIQIIFGLILLSLYHPIFIIFGVILVLLLYVILKLTSEKGLRSSMDESTHKYEVVAWMQEMARVILTFKYSQGTHLNLKKTDFFVVRYLQSRTAHFKVLLFQYNALVAFKVFITAAMLIVGTYLLLNQKLNIGEFIAAEIVILSVIAAVEKLIGALEHVYDVITSLEKLASITESIKEKDGTVDLQTKQQGVSIQMKELTFDYPDGNKVLKNINFEISANSTTCISSKEGSGKSTLLKILSGNYTDYEGDLIINNVPIKNYTLESLRKNTGIFVNLQEVFAGTVLENITMGREHISLEMITSLASQLGVQNGINELIHGYATQIDPAGIKLKSTLVKHILLLRALIHQPALILLEEPWHGSDEQIKQNILSYIFKIAAHSTVIIASDDDAFMKLCNYHIVLSNGYAQMKKNS